MAEEKSMVPEISDQTVREGTGHGLETWFALLDQAGAMEMHRRQLLAVLRAEADISRWWACQVALAYDRFRKSRGKNSGRRILKVEIDKTVRSTYAWLFHAWKDPGIREQWLAADVTLRSTSDLDTLHFLWHDGSVVHVRLRPAAIRERIAITVVHTKLRDTEQVEEMKEFWKDALYRLSRLG